MRTTDFDFHLSDELIAQEPAVTRDASRLLVLDRRLNRVVHEEFCGLLHYLRPGDVLVLNNSRVIPARLRATNPKTGGSFEVLLLDENSRNDWWAMMRPAKRARVGSELWLLDHNAQCSAISVTVTETNEERHRRLRFSGENDVTDLLDRFGEVPLPPYIKRESLNRSDTDRTRYQTVYAQEKGSVAAPTAGLHFTNEMLSLVSARGVEICYVTLHVGLGTFAPVKAERLQDHEMHFERFHVDEVTAEKINSAKRERRRAIAVGTTSVRVLETLAQKNEGRIEAGSGRTNIFIYPPYEFRIVDGLVTNFHLPRSTLLMLVSAFAAPGETNGREKILAAYAEAINRRYRFFSYGDAMLIL